MENLAAALAAANLNIPVSTAISMQPLSTSYPPSAGDFSEAAKPVMAQIANFLQSKGYPLLVNVYPYFARAGDPANVDLDFALFRPGKTAVHDGELTYLNLFDSMTDAAYAALEKVGAGGVEIIVSETGWPSDGGTDAGVENAQTYVNNLIGHVASGRGTPRRPGKQVEAYIFSLFNENMKHEGVEQHWGLFYPNLAPVYKLNTPGGKIGSNPIPTPVYQLNTTHAGKIGSGKRIKTLTLNKQMLRVIPVAHYVLNKYKLNATTK
ncbi:putative glucan endo-1,3-beta-glucosidase GVI [Salvia splendens]|uniref:putative glucan endo-1,3-beta-glucosidase GVI n=1 Tax=Salvia splendens TaxID=180675 RepID=UPI001C272449|nr:putative glucan endo-1,3-beta-glucosidase GVI [Salvia splendens]